MLKNTKYIKVLQQLIYKGVGTQSFYMPNNFTIKLSKSEFTMKPVTCSKIVLRPVLVDKWLGGEVILSAKTEACVGKNSRKKEQHYIEDIKDVSALEALIKKLYSKDEINALKNIIKDKIEC